jgi:hypothetical protein
MSTEIKLGQPRPIEEQTWRRHHRLRVPQTKPARSMTSGSARRKRKAIARRQWSIELLEQKQAER